MLRTIHCLFSAALLLFWSSLYAGAIADPPRGSIGSVESGSAKRHVETPPTQVLVDTVWAGTGVNYDALSIGSVVYLAYYDAERYLTVARFDAQRRSLTRKRLASRFDGWDAHNNLVLAVDPAGHLHVAGNMHTSPLVYARTLRADDFDSLTLMNRMIGTDEDSTTYPQFFRFPNGDLGFTYRSGQSGNGVELINRFDGERWHRELSDPIFAPATPTEHVNAYHTGYVPGPDGRFHTAWVWRKTRMAETNFHVNYAFSPDLRTWFDSGGSKIELPLTPANADVADAVPQGGGLANNVRLGFDPKGRPVISYLKYDSAGHTQLYHARPSPEGWQVASATQWDYRWAFAGAGTLLGEISFSGVRSTPDGKLVEEVSHRIYGRLHIELDPNDLRGISRPAAPPQVRPTPGAVRATGPFRAVGRAVRQQSHGAVAAEFRWHTLGAANNDQPRTCESLNLPATCQMTGPLQLWIY